jgi:hypothetical protein
MWYRMLEIRNYFSIRPYNVKRRGLNLLCHVFPVGTFRRPITNSQLGEKWRSIENDIPLQGLHGSFELFGMRSAHTQDLI